MHPLFLRGTSPTLRLGLLSVLSVALMFADARMNYLDNLRHYFYASVSPLYYAVGVPIQSAQTLAQSFSQRRLLLMENQHLRDQNLRLQVQHQRLSDLQDENKRLRHLLGAAPKFVEKMLIAEVMAVDLDPFSRKMVINRGDSDDVRLGLPVFDAQGVMGQVMELGSLTSMVMLITDPDHTLPVQIARTGLHTLAAGTGVEDVLELLYLPNTAEIRIGDEIVTSGLGERFPRGYPVGVITTFHSTIGKSYAEAKARPSALLDRNRDVLLIWPPRSSPTEASIPSDTPQ